MSKRVVITGAFSYVGAAVARELLRTGWTVHTLTNRTRPPDVDNITVAPLTFDPDHLARELTGADAFVNTYWVRLPHDGMTFETAVANSLVLVQSAAQASVGRLVHVSVSNASLDSRLGYYRGKAQVDLAVRQSGLSHAIVRPTLVVGPHDVLTSNVAWFLRRFPLFPIPSGGNCRLQPVTLDDTARVIADAVDSREDMDVDAAGPEVMTFRAYLEEVAAACNARPWWISTPGWVSLAALRILEIGLRDVVLTREELDGLQQELLLSRKPGIGTESVLAWLRANADQLGREYVNDVQRHFGAGRTKAVLSLSKLPVRARTAPRAEV